MTNQQDEQDERAAQERADSIERDDDLPPDEGGGRGVQASGEHGEDIVEERTL